MPWKPRLSAGVVRCGRCGKHYTNPFTHVCVRRMGSKRPAGTSKIKPKARVSLVTCGTCGKSYNNLFTHVCRTKTDFKKRKADAAKATPKAGPGKQHPEPEDCRDQDCPRFPCRVYRRGFAAGYTAGFTEGHLAGHTEGYQK